MRLEFIHKKNHISFKDSGAFGIFSGRSSWSANEEVRLLDAIEQFGFGNWEDIAKHIETRTPEGMNLNYTYFLYAKYEHAL